MPRIRTIKPEFWEDEKLSEIPIQARLLFIGTWSFADDWGVLPNSIKWIKAKIFPYDTLRDNDVKQWLDALIKNRMIVRFSEDGKAYLMIRRFRSHQIIDKRYEKSILGAPILEKVVAATDFDTTTKLQHSEPDVTTMQEGKGEEMEGKGSGKEVENKAVFPDGFFEIWENWKEYKQSEHREKFKTLKAEQTAINKLVEISLGSAEIAKLIVNESISNRWKGLFPLKNQANGTYTGGVKKSNSELMRDLIKSVSGTE